MEMNLYPIDWKFRDANGCTYRDDEVIGMVKNGNIDTCNDLMKIWFNSGFNKGAVKIIHEGALRNMHMFIRKTVRPQDIVHAMSWIENLQSVFRDSRTMPADQANSVRNAYMSCMADKLEQWHKSKKAILPLHKSVRK